ncbi:60S acidic ribosomal protein P1 [Neocallimastix lanati (nom. inval.)]|jgi:large subunit ribosomal protein LP1|uniref:60S acidic ribosomal protein P1 n=1 Tax=Neocallimastix californiae TaxID=1754190 RepID=A0A1Y2BTF4_9FUNG|nr:60S acidic ribosomal protein P1 [Neocallimastix sp. JGI-2020a]ORY38023.1 60S acidic ribosomal protein P1 [Neocallimastix californiae]|eukprot:ORY38023.1 60S acidic ribosomal protein P1 [Neocallimastix californiae]
MVMSDSEAACVYAALILQDEGLDISVEMLEKIINASGLAVENIYPKIFAKALDGKDIKEYLFNIGSNGSGAAVAGGAAAGAAGAAAEEEKEEEKEEEEESDSDMGFGLFD